MKKELKILVYSMINNFVIAIIKIIGGAFYGLGSLYADGMHTFSDFVTDIICLIGSKISKHKPTKYHPFGFGQVEYLTNLFVGIILLLLGIYIIVSSFFKKTVIPPLSVLILLLSVFLLKLLAIMVMAEEGKKNHSQVLITSVEESKADLYSTIGVAFVTIILQFSNRFAFLKYADLLLGIIIGIIVLKTAFKIIVDNSLSLIGESEINEEETNKINQILDNYSLIKKYKYDLIKYGDYYKMHLNLELDSTLSLRKVANFETKLKKEIIRHRSNKVKYISIFVTNNLN